VLQRDHGALQARSGDRGKLALATRVAFGVYAQNCHDCRGPKGAEYRKQWGCDVEAGEQDRITCYACDEDTLGCPRCKDERWVQLRRCPKAIVDRALLDVVRVALWSREGGPLPCPGGTLDQAAAYITAREIVFREAGICEKELMRDGD